MTTPGYTRKLTTIFSADVAGYSRLMGEDETATVKTLTSYRNILAELIRQHHGRVIDSPGDNMLAEFPSVVDAVQCAVSIQKEIHSRNEELPETRRMDFRLGINLGDVIEEDGRIYGDGVNVAARLEALADPGGICISKTVFEYVESKLPLSYERLGEQKVRNITKPVGAYRVLMESKVTAAKQKQKLLPVIQRKRMLAGAAALVLIVMCGFIWSTYLRGTPTTPVPEVETALPLPDKPSIAVLPFKNMSGDPSQEYLSDGISEEIITALSRVPKLFVIARHSSFTYKGKPVWVPTVGIELGVGYVLGGSVRREDEKLRVAAQLIEAKTNQQLWAERYDRKMKDIFEIQDEITKKVVTALQVKLTEGEQARVYSRGTSNLEAYLKLLKGREQMNRFNKEGNALARQTIEAAIALSPQYPVAYVLLAITHFRDALLRSTSTPKRSVAKAIQAVQKAIALDGALAEAYGLLAYLSTMTKKHEEAVAQAERAVAINPNSADARFFLAIALNFSFTVDRQF